MSDPYAGWEETPADPHAGWTETPAVAAPRPQAQPQPKPVDWLTALARGAGQGATASFGDEANGLVQALGQKYLPESLGGAGAQARGMSLTDLYRGNRASFGQENAAAEKDHGGLYLAGNVLGGVPLAIATSGKGKTLGALVKGGTAMGALSGLGSSKADLTRGDFLGALIDAGLGGLFGMAGGAAGYGLGKALNAGASWAAGKAGQKVAEATEKIAQLAKDSAGKVTQSARSAAGTSATAAYKNATNIEEAIKAGAMALEDLTPEQQSLYRSLLKERASKGAQDLAGDAARKTAKGTEYADALASEQGRTAEAVDRIGNPMNQLMPRLKRYGPVALGAAAGHYLFPGMGLGAGGFAGAALRPTIHALLRMTQHPSVGRPLWNTLGAIARGVGYSSGAAPMLGGPSGRALTPELEQALMPMLLAAGRSGQDAQSPLAAMGANR